MSNALKCLAAAMVVLIGLSVAHGEPPASQPAGDGPAARPGMMIERLKQITSDLKLTDAQKTKLDEIYSKASADMKEMRAELEKMAPNERGQELVEFFKGVKDQVFAQLDDEQRKLFDKKTEEERARFRQGGGNGEMAERLRQNLEKLDLTAEQKSKIKTLMEGVKEKTAALREKVNPASDEFREQMTGVLKEMRDGLAKTLTPEQSEKLRSMMGDGFARAGAPTSRPSEKKETAMTDDKMAPDKMAPDMMSVDKKSPRVAPKEESKEASESARTGPGVGEPAPDFQLKKIDGNVISLSQMKGRIVVVEFGSYSCPVFRAKAAAMEELKSQMGQRATFVLIYTKEAHPAGKWDVERNKDDGISVEEPLDLDARKATASKAREKLKITMPIALDDMNNSVADAYGLAPNGAVIIGRDGKILTKQKWVDPFALRSALDTAVAAKPTTKPAANGG